MMGKVSVVGGRVIGHEGFSGSFNGVANADLRGEHVPSIPSCQRTEQDGEQHRNDFHYPLAFTQTPQTKRSVPATAPP